MRFLYLFVSWRYSDLMTLSFPVITTKLIPCLLPQSEAHVLLKSHCQITRDVPIAATIRGKIEERERVTWHAIPGIRVATSTGLSRPEVCLLSPVTASQQSSGGVSLASRKKWHMMRIIALISR